MVNCQLHPLVFKHLNLNYDTGLYRKHILVSYSDEVNDRIVFPGIRQAAIYRLKYPEVHLFFFSFLPIEVLQLKDNYGILSLTGTHFVRLPCDNSKLHGLVKNVTHPALIINSDQWKLFSENASRLLLRERIAEMMHSKKHAVGNQALHPLRAAAVMLLNNPDNANCKQAFVSRLDAYKDYMNKPHMREIFEWTEIFKNPNDHFVNRTIDFARQLEIIAMHGNSMKHTRSLISEIDKANNLIKLLYS
jgi:hypothetical protein